MADECKECVIGIPNIDYDLAARLWSQYVGSQGTDEFMWYASTDNIREAVEEYLNSLPEDWLDNAPGDLADMLTAYIVRDVCTGHLRRE
jgi:hypothetical protein